MPVWSTSQCRSFWRWGFTSDPFYSVSSVSLSPSCGYFSSSGMHNWNRHTKQLENPHVGSLICGMRAIMVGKAKWKPLELPPSRKIVNKKQYLISGGTAEISATIKDLKDAGVVIPLHPYSACLFGLCRKQMNLGEWQCIIVCIPGGKSSCSCCTRCGFVAWTN